MSLSLTRATPALAIVAVLGCGGKPKPEEPAPQPPVTTTWTPPANPRPATPKPADDTAERRARLEERIHFGYDRSDLSTEARQALMRKADILHQMPGATLRIEGHADERGSDEYNLALGSRRAAAAKQFLVARGINGSRIEVTSLGEEQPLDRRQGEAAWAANRRAEFRVGSFMSAR